MEPNVAAAVAESPSGAQGRQQVVLHVDMDAFFASVEQLDHPEWRGRPVVVGSDPKGGEGRGVVAASSYEARKFGIHSAMPISQAWRACPTAVYVRPRGERYREVSRQVRAVFRRFAGERVEPVSIDEAYLDVTHLLDAGTYPDTAAVGRALKEAVQAETGLTCSVGVAPSKSAAKIASDMDKPDGLTIVPPDEVRAFLAPLPVRRIPGVGPKTAAWLDELSVQTVGDLAEKNEAWAEERFGKNGLHVWRLARGIDPRPVESDDGLAKSRSEEHTFPVDTASPSEIHRVVRRMAAELVEEMERHRILFRVVGLKIRTERFDTFTRATTLKVPTRRLEPVLMVLRDQLSEFVDGVQRYRLVGVRLAGLEEDVGQSTLEDWIAEGMSPEGLSRFPPWSIPGSAVRRPGQQHFGRDI